MSTEQIAFGLINLANKFEDEARCKFNEVEMKSSDVNLEETVEGQNNSLEMTSTDDTIDIMNQNEDYSINDELPVKNDPVKMECAVDMSDTSKEWNLGNIMNFVKQMNMKMRQNASQ